MNREKPHVLVLPEDDANRQLAVGFLRDTDLDDRAIQVLRVAGGWTDVMDLFRKNHRRKMEKYPDRHMVLLLDFDRDADRRVQIQAAIPTHLTDRVFIIGVLSEPEELKRAIHESLESIGKRLAQECRDGHRDVWNHDLLRHNAVELDRMADKLTPILFPS